MQTPADVNLAPLCRDLSLPCGTSRTLPDFGVALSAATYLTRSVALVGEASVFDNLWYSSLTKEGKENNYVRLLLAGIRASLAPPSVSGGKARGVRLFGQVLAGTEWSSVLPSRRAVQPGAGIDARFPSGVILRIEVDYTLAPGDGRNLSGTRALVGMVYGFGSREP